MNLWIMRGDVAGGASCVKLISLWCDMACVVMLGFGGGCYVFVVCVRGGC